YTLVVGGTTFEVDPGIAVVRVNGQGRRLATAPTVDRGALLVPLQLVSEIIPSTVTNTSWDADRRQLVLFSMVEHASAGTRPVPTPARDPAPTVTQAGHRSRRTIIVDAGHGGPDNGMTGPLGSPRPTLVEKDITLAVAKRLGSTLRTRGFDVVYTRTTD